MNNELGCQMTSQHRGRPQDLVLTSPIAES